MEFRVVREGDGHRLDGPGLVVEVANGFLSHLETRGFAGATVRGYAYDLLNLARFLGERGLGLVEVVPTDLFDWLEWQARPRRTPGKVVRLDQARGAAPATMNRRIAAARGLFEYAGIIGVRGDSPVPAPRRSSGLRARRRQGLLGHVKPRRDRGQGGRLVRQPRRLPESLDVDDVAVFLADPNTHRDRAMVLAMLQGGLRAAEVRGLTLAGIDFGLRQLRVTGKGGRERIVPVDRAFFTELASYLRVERPAGLATEEVFVVLRGPTCGQPLTEAGTHDLPHPPRQLRSDPRAAPPAASHLWHRTRYAEGIDLLVLQELMGHTDPETTAAYVHLSPEVLAAEYARATQASR